ncbi:hypothetical protein CYMTET_26865 [Cymbomonas tetramitiformis]|uniref:Uncharacterized protein n=1 Tax=Cymbomonas tetramitiformis TaxID=36881 RepID=A0AAE0KXK4_9CHLO|nr:hypothetical protein CYMTET_26865 [Cymbomonas tetramitiformis]
MRAVQIATTSRALGCHAVTLDVLVAHLRTDVAETKEHAAAALLRLAKGTPNKSVFHRGGAILPLASLLLTGSERGQVIAAAILAEVALDADSQLVLCNSGAVGVLVAMLKSGTKAAKGRAAEILLLLSTREENHAVLRTEGVPRVLVDTVNSTSLEEDDRLARAATVAVVHLASQSQSLQSLDEAGGTPLLLQLLQEKEGEEPEAASLTLALWRRIQLGGPTMQALVDNGVVATLVHVARVGSQVAQESAVGALSSLTEMFHNPCCQLIRKSRGLPELVNALKRGTRAAKGYAAQTLEQLAEDPEGPSEILQAVGILPLLALLKAPEVAYTPLAIQGSVMAIMHRLVGHRPSRETLRKVGAVTILATWLPDPFCEDEDVDGDVDGEVKEEPSSEGKPAGRGELSHQGVRVLLLVLRALFTLCDTALACREDLASANALPRLLHVMHGPYPEDVSSQWTWPSWIPQNIVLAVDPAVARWDVS